MRGIRIAFDEGGPRFNFSQPVGLFESVVQNALVNVGTNLGSDPIFKDRGTDLKRDGAHGRMATSTWADHSANFAALRTLAFIQQTDTKTNPFKLREFDLRCDQVVLDEVVLNVRAVSSLGQIVGGFANI
jgi:hypothetical protein